MKVSIITATYNSAATVEHAIASVRKQLYDRIEHIFIDGNSSDNTLDIIRECARSPFKVLSESDNGIYDALNKGIGLATGDIIGFLHSDDYFTNQHVVSNIVSQFSNEETDIVYTDLEYVSKSNRRVRLWRAGEFTRDKLYWGWMPPHPTMFMTRQLATTRKFSTKYEISSDYDMILNLLTLGNVRVSYIPKVSVSMRVGGASNKNLKSIIRKMDEDYRIVRDSKVGGVLTILMKNFRKVPQFFVKGRS